MTELKIVYIDDEPDIREVAEIALSLDPGIEVRTFGSGPEGLKALDDGIGPDLMEGARAAVAGMIDLLSKKTGMTAVDAYMLCSVCGDLRISEIVDQPNWVVSFYFPRVVLG